MHEVKEALFGVPCETRLWISSKANDEINEFRIKGDPNGAFWKKLKHYAVSGFSRYEGGQGYPIKHEGDGVYRIGIDSSLFRIIGFYEGGNKKSFIAIDAYLKSKTKRSAAESERCNQVARVKREGSWKKV